jgi:DNA-binding response OmpR family regulator
MQSILIEQRRRTGDVLIVEDDDTIRAMLADTLSAEGFHIREAADGLAGIVAARLRRPDVIVLDLMMPRLDGNGVLEALAADEHLGQVPVIVTSAYPKRLRPTGQVRKVMPKPFDLWELLDSVRDLSS